MLSLEPLVERCAAFGTVLRAWEGTQPRGQMPGAIVVHGPLPAGDANRFARGVHVLLRTSRPVAVYRAYRIAPEPVPEADADAGDRPPGLARLGRWWSPEPPGTGVAAIFRAARERSEAAAGDGWGRFDAYAEATLAPGSMLYAGRIAPHAEELAFETPDGPAIFPSGGVLGFRLVPGEATLRAPRRFVFR